MSPAYREPPRRDEGQRSVWSPIGIYVALIVLTILMALVFHNLSSEPAPNERPEIRATR